MASRVAPMTAEPTVRQRRPKVEASAHLNFVRGLSCVICGTRPVDPAHLRIASHLIGKRPVGVAEKPDDKFCTPLCRKHHNEQHSMSEFGFWVGYGIENPWQLCLAIFAASIAKDAELAEQIVIQHRQMVLR